MKQPTEKTGFTLIEVLLYVNIVGVVLTIISVFLVIFLNARVKNQVVAEVERQGNQTMQLITQTIRNADTITAPAIGVSAASTTLTVPTGANSPTIFDLSTGVIRITEGAGSAEALTSNRVTASALSFHNLTRVSDNVGVLRIQFTLTHINPGNKNEYNYSQTFYGTASLR